MKTVLIFDQCGESPIEFYVIEGDYSRLEGVYINSTVKNQKLQDELHDLFYNEAGEKLLKKRKKFPTKAVRAGAIVVVCGFLP